MKARWVLSVCARRADIATFERAASLHSFPNPERTADRSASRPKADRPLSAHFTPLVSFAPKVGRSCDFLTSSKAVVCPVFTVRLQFAQLRQWNRIIKLKSGREEPLDMTNRSFAGVIAPLDVCL